MPVIRVENSDLLCRDIDEVALSVIIEVHALRQAAIRSMPSTVSVAPHGPVTVLSVEAPHMTVRVHKSGETKKVKIPKKYVPKE